MDSIINRIELDGVEYTGGAMIAAYVAAVVLLLIQYARPL